MTMLTIGVVKETMPGERRVALVPSEVGKLNAGGLAVLVETSAGVGGWFADEAYAKAGAEIVTASELSTQADVIVSVAEPSAEITAHFAVWPDLRRHASASREPRTDRGLGQAWHNHDQL